MPMQMASIDEQDMQELARLRVSMFARHSIGYNDSDLSFRLTLVIYSQTHVFIHFVKILHYTQFNKIFQIKSFKDNTDICSKTTSFVTFLF